MRPANVQRKMFKDTSSRLSQRGRLLIRRRRKSSILRPGTSMRQNLRHRRNPNPKRRKDPEFFLSKTESGDTLISKRQNQKMSRKSRNCVLPVNRASQDMLMRATKQLRRRQKNKRSSSGHARVSRPSAGILTLKVTGAPKPWLSYQDWCRPNGFFVLRIWGERKRRSCPVRISNNQS